MQQGRHISDVRIPDILDEHKWIAYWIQITVGMIATRKELMTGSNFLSTKQKEQNFQLFEFILFYNKPCNNTIV